IQRVFRGLIPTTRTTASSLSCAKASSQRIPWFSSATSLPYRVKAIAWACQRRAHGMNCSTATRRNTAAAAWLIPRTCPAAPSSGNPARTPSFSRCPHWPPSSSNAVQAHQRKNEVSCFEIEKRKKRLEPDLRHQSVGRVIRMDLVQEQAGGYCMIHIDVLNVFTQGHSGAYNAGDG